MQQHLMASLLSSINHSWTVAPAWKKKEKYATKLNN